MIIRIPRRFFDDHCDRELPAPELAKGPTGRARENRASVWIDADDLAMLDLIEDARYYAADDGPDNAGTIKAAAETLLDSLRRQGIIDRGK